MNTGIALSPNSVQHQIERALRALERRREGDVEVEPLRLQLAAGLARFRDALLGQIDVAPAGEQVLQIPLALAVTHEHEKTFSHCCPQKSFNPRTSIIE